jgi:hypothetical protein
MSAIHLSEVQEKRFDILVLDACRDESFEAVEYAKDLGWLAKVIFVSRVDGLGVRLKASEIRCDAFFVLPDDMRRFKLLIKAFVEDLC